MTPSWEPFCCLWVSLFGAKVVMVGGRVVRVCVAAWVRGWAHFGSHFHGLFMGPRVGWVQAEQIVGRNTQEDA